MDSGKTFTAECFGQAAGTGFKTSMQEIVFSFYVFSQIIILENINLYVLLQINDSYFLKGKDILLEMDFLHYSPLSWGYTVWIQP